MNDAAQTVYTNESCLPFLNMSLDELQEVFELNDIPVTHETSKAIKIPINIDRIGHDTMPALPSDLIEIRQLWESESNQEKWIPMHKVDVLPHYRQDGVQVSRFGVWALEQTRVRFIAANTPLDIKFDYTANMFNTPILIKDIRVNLPFTNVKTYLEYKTAALCALFIAENETRAVALDSLAGTALSRALGIPIKGQQSITTRRRPFRYSHKHRGVRV